MSDERFVELEIKVAYQEDLVQSLNLIVSKQQRQIDQLEATSRMLLDRLKSMQMDAPEENVDQTPPHY